MAELDARFRRRAGALPAVCRLPAGGSGRERHAAGGIHPAGQLRQRLGPGPARRLTRTARPSACNCWAGPKGKPRWAGSAWRSRRPPTGTCGGPTSRRSGYSRSAAAPALARSRRRSAGVSRGGARSRRLASGRTPGLVAGSPPGQRRVEHGQRPQRQVHARVDPVPLRQAAPRAARRRGHSAREQQRQQGARQPQQLHPGAFSGRAAV